MVRRPRENESAAVWNQGLEGVPAAGRRGERCGKRGQETTCERGTLQCGVRGCKWCPRRDAGARDVENVVGRLRGLGLAEGQLSGCDGYFPDSP